MHRYPPLINITDIINLTISVDTINQKSYMYNDNLLNQKDNIG